MKKAKLFLIPFAGGNYYSFQFMFPYLNDYDVIPLELPGRGKRIQEDLLTDFEAAAQDCFDGIMSSVKQSQFLIYGHSLGAYLGLRVSNMLSKAGKSPLTLIVSGNPGPGLKNDKLRHSLNYEEFVKELDDLGGVSKEVLENKDLINFYEPILRADFKIAEINDIASEAPVDIPLFAMMGNKERKVNHISNWARFTRSEFNYSVLEGGHFFINHYPKYISQIIDKCYYKAVQNQNNHKFQK
ncbi:thioesterase II family protein [Mucilaginibacter lappiensis]|uniref:Surfactin synthase thioesterase subunit n=1 Tax=Mucilaginibacter lappiensis TaxID=354630 RepID=A0A841JAN5_9SPHI|nr:thioesterase [Mucilaginibacter lappiensis]MBB6127422.1 surfactin synthase thioesterase subunit [Mucilaginibacter lappiensis]